MNASVEDLRATIIPKSDQLNAEQLLGGSMTITVSDVRLGSGEDQPVVVHYQGENGRPFKPCKTMRKVLIHAWGADGRKWVGRSMTLYNDPAVKFGGEDVGGIRISHMTDIERDIKVSLTSTRGKKAKYEIRRLAAVQGANHDAAIVNAATVEDLKAAFGAAYKSTKDDAKRAAFKASYDARMVALTASPSKPAATLAHYRELIDNALDSDAAATVLDEARSVLDAADHEALTTAWRERWQSN